MKWTIVTEQSYERWAAETDDELDVELRIEVLTWILALRDAGPPPQGVHDPFRDTLHCEVGTTGVWVGGESASPRSARQLPTPTSSTTDRLPRRITIS